jgi:hypothetical protein
MLSDQTKLLKALEKKIGAGRLKHVPVRLTLAEHAYPHSSAAIVCDLTTDTEVADGTRQG